MEYQVRTVAGIESCYVSLPLSLIQRLDSSARPNFSSQILCLHLQSSSTPSLYWHVAWSGSASTSPSVIEVSQQFADCIGLPDRSLVVVRALPNVAKASFVTIEPLTEDDWEVLELNSEAAESAILSQVRIVSESMRFPLWLHGHAVVTFVVISTVPKHAVVQLVPGAEVAVAPKRRQKSGNYSKESKMQSLDGSHPFEPVLLRVQDPKKMLLHNSNIGDVDVKIEISTIALIHPDTGKSCMFDPLQAVVLIPRVQLKAKLNENEGIRKKVSSSLKDANGQTSTRDTESRYAVVQILFSETVAKGHLMLSLALRRYLGASLHSWIYVQRYVNHLKELPIFSCAPCQFITEKKNRDPKSNAVEAFENDSLSKSMIRQSSEENIGMLNLSVYQKHVSSIPFEVASKEGEDASYCSDPRKGVHGLLLTWSKAQCHAIRSISGVEPSYLILGPINFLHFAFGDPGVDGKLQKLAINSTQRRRGAREPSKEILCSLRSTSEQLTYENFVAYELSIGPNSKGDLTSVTEKLVIESAASFESVKEEVFNHQFSSTCSDLNWLSGPASDATNSSHCLPGLIKLLSPGYGLESTINIPLPGHILIYGPSGSGKSLLATAVANSLEKDELLVHIVYVPCSAFVSEKVMTIHQELKRSVSEALDHAPALIIFDDLDRIIPSSVDSEGPDESASVALTELVISMIDEYEEKCMGSCGLGPIAFVACVQSVDSIPQSLRTTGRFDFHIQLPAPASSERMAILKHEIMKHLSECSEDILQHVASKADGYDAHDLETLTNRSILVGMRHSVDPDTVFEETGRQSLNSDDFVQAMEEFVPSSMHDVTDSSLAGRPGWEDVGGLVDVRNAIKEMIELPSKFPNVFAKSPLRLRSNVLLYGPPGCGKTHLVGAAAAASSLRFISVKGPELLNKYIGASEQSVRDVFAKAAAAAPCLLFFDEFDSIAPKRGHDNTGVTDRVVNQFLTELDGVEVLTGVFVFAATSRPDLLDAALLRPGRLDRLLFCDFPSLTDRLDILKTLSRKLPLADDVDWIPIAHITEGFSGADLRALLSDAEEAAIKKLKHSADEGKPRKPLILTNELLQTVASKAKPSVSQSEKQRLYGIYSQFLSSKKSAASKSRDRKGKRATLA